MSLSFFIVTILYLALILYIHHKLRRTKEPTKINTTPDVYLFNKEPVKLNNTPNVQFDLDTIISLDDIGNDLDNETIKDLKKFLATPEIKAKENRPPIIENLDLNEYFGADSDSGSDSEKVPDDSTVVGTTGTDVQPFDSIKAFDDFGGYDNYATF